VERQSLTFRAEQDAGEASLAVTGEIDMMTAESLYERASSLVADDTRLLVLDMGGVTFCDSLGVAALVRIFRHSSGLGCRLRLTNLHGPVAHVIQISGLDQVLEVRAG
jgi:anti-sigma B factor antagonist